MDVERAEALTALRRWTDQHGLAFVKNFEDEEGNVYPGAAVGQWGGSEGMEAYVDEQGNLMLNTDDGFVQVAATELMTRLPQEF